MSAHDHPRRHGRSRGSYDGSDSDERDTDRKQVDTGNGEGGGDLEAILAEAEQAAKAAGDVDRGAAQNSHGTGAQEAMTEGTDEEEFDLSRALEAGIEASRRAMAE